MMNHHQKHPSLLVRNSAWRRAFERLDESLDQNSDYSNAELLDRMGRHPFGDLWHATKDPAPKNNENQKEWWTQVGSGQ
jgi:hypothetical protein